MEFSHFSRCALACAALLVPAACAGSQAPMGSAGALPAQATAASHGVRGAWMSPEAKSRDLLYVADLGTNSVDVYRYSNAQLVGTLTGFGSVASLCSDSKGNVYVVDEAGPVDVYAHAGTSPIRQLPTAGAPDGCSVDPTTGNLALTNESSYLHGVVTIYANAQGKGKIYRNKNVDATFFCGYDGKGNLFIDGWNRLGAPILLQLPSGGKTFGVAKLHNFANLGGVEWDGRYVAIADRGAGLVYRMNGSGQVMQTVHLNGVVDIDQFWIAGKTIIGPDAKSDGNVYFWKYPDGGGATTTLTGLTYPVGVTISLAH